MRCSDVQPIFVFESRLILSYLIPLRLMRGVLPNPALLDSFNRLRLVYRDLITAFKLGNLEEFDKELGKHEKNLLESGTYLVVLRAREGCLRTLCKKVYVLCSSFDPPCLLSLSNPVCCEKKINQVAHREQDHTDPVGNVSACVFVWERFHRHGRSRVPFGQHDPQGARAKITFIPSSRLFLTHSLYNNRGI
jgi:hypothetical protein